MWLVNSLLMYILIIENKGFLGHFHMSIYFENFCSTFLSLVFILPNRTHFALRFFLYAGK